jgi:shikimate kinase
MQNYNVRAKEVCGLLERLSPRKPLVLVGSAGSGKSTVGRRLAKKLRLQFYDSDKMIEQREGLSVVEIYDKFGEEYFVQREKEVIEEVLTSYGLVVLSTGSNSFINPYLHDFIKNNSITIWLYAELSVLSQRISRRNSRPGFTPENTDALLQFVMTEHYPLYGQAKLSVESHEHDIYKVVDTVIDSLKNYLMTSHG